MPPSKLTYARYAYLADNQFHEHVWIRSINGIITEITHSPSRSPSFPPPDSVRADESAYVLLPGFINAHCHLEYTHLEQKLPQGPIPFGEWLTAIITTRGDNETEQRIAGMRDGARRLAEGGTILVFDSTTDGSSANHLRDAGIHSVLFHEVLGLNLQRSDAMWNAAIQRIQSESSAASTRDETIQFHAINPHAPYSVGESLKKQLTQHIDLLKEYGCAWHLAETQDESELFLSNRGSLAEFLDRFGMGRPWGANPTPACSPYEYLNRESLAGSCDLVFHGDRLSPIEAARFTGDRGIVFCPGAHRWFERPPYPLTEFIAAGANICIGTDSLAGCESLSMKRMLAIVAEDYPEISDNNLIAMATSNPGKLRILKNTGHNFGKIEIGFRASFTNYTQDELPQFKGNNFANSIAKQ